MALGWLIGGAIIGALLASGSENDDRIVYIDPSKKKVEFFDLYREIDVVLSRLVGEGSGGYGLLVSAMSYDARRKQNADFYKAVNKMKAVRDYRNNLAHNRSRWGELPDPEPWMMSLLKDLYNQIDTYPDDYRHAVAGALKSAQQKRLSGGGKH